LSQPLLAKAYGATVGKLSADSIETLPLLLDRFGSPLANHQITLLGQLNAGPSKLFATTAGHQKAGNCGGSSSVACHKTEQTS